MPRGIGARTGVNDTVTFSPATAERFCANSGVWRWAPPTPYALAEPITSEPSRFGLRLLPAPEVPVTATTVTSGSTSPAAKAGARASEPPVGKQPGTATRLVPTSFSRAPGSSGRPYGHCPAWSPPYQRRQSAGSARRWSAPRSTTRTSGPSWAAISAECPWGSARKTTSWPARVSGVVSARTRPARGTRWGWWTPSFVPALLAAVSVPISTSGWARSRRSSSPPAYPLAPATAMFTVIRMIMHALARLNKQEYREVVPATLGCWADDGHPGAAARPALAAPDAPGVAGQRAGRPARRQPAHDPPRRRAAARPRLPGGGQPRRRGWLPAGGRHRDAAAGAGGRRSRGDRRGVADGRGADGLGDRGS